MKQAIALLLIFILLISGLLSIVQAADNTVVPQDSAPIKKAITLLAKADPKKPLELAKKYYDLGISKATAHEKMYLPMIINWKPDFSGKTKDKAKSAMYLNSSAYLTAYTDLKGIYLPMAAAVFALDTGNATAAGNFASAIATYSEDTVKKQLGTALNTIGETKTYAADASLLYEYALALRLTNARIDIASLPLLLNYGYLCIDTNKLDNARIMFETAMKLTPGYMPAAEGMAAYWVAKGDKEKAKEVLAGAAMPAIMKKQKEMQEAASQKNLPRLNPMDSSEAVAQKIPAYDALAYSLATDFYENIDPQGASAARRFVDGLQSSIKYTAPNFSYLSQYSNLKSFKSGAGQAAYEAFCTILMELEEALNENDLTDEEAEQLGQDIDGMQNGAVNIPYDIQVKLSPETIIFQLKTGNYANPTDIVSQMHNMGLLRLKLAAYDAYFMVQIREIKEIIDADREKIEPILASLEEGMWAELDNLDKEHNSSHKTKNGICNACIIKTHSIHQSYDDQLNRAAETTWMDAVNFVNARYMQKIKPNLESMYNQSMRICLLTSDPFIRMKIEEKIAKRIKQYTLMFWTLVDDAYSIDVKAYPYECDCSEAEIAAARARQQKDYDEYEYNKTVMENKARKEFEEGKVPENSKLYQQLDKYTANFHLLFMDTKMHPLKTELAFNVKVPGIDTGVNFKMTENHMRNTTTYGGGLTATVFDKSAAGGALGASASVSVQGEATVDGRGNVVSADIAAGAQGAVTTGWKETNIAYEASVQRGCKISAEVADIHNDGMVKTPETLKPLDSFSQGEKPRKVLWKGEHQF